MFQIALDNLFSSYSENYSGNPDHDFDFYEDNALTLDAIDELDNEQLYKYEIIVSRYIAALAKKKDYKKLIQRSKIILAVIEKNEARLHIGRAITSAFNSITYYRAIAEHNTFLFRAARRHFEEVLKFDPQSDNLKFWIRSSTLRYRFFVNIMIALVAILCSLFLKKYLPQVAIYALDAAYIVFTVIAFRNNFLAKKLWRVGSYSK